MVKNKMSPKTKQGFIPALSITIILLVMLTSSVLGQTVNGITLTKPDSSLYPVISTSFRAIDPEGRFVKDLAPDDLQVMENNRLVTVDSLDLVQEGVRFYVAVNEGRTLANRFEEVSRFDRIKAHLLKWIKSQTGETRDEFDLRSNQSDLNIDPTDPADWEKAINNYQPDLRKTTPGLASLTSTVDAVLNSGINATKSAALLYITPLPTAQEVSEIKDLLTRAAKGGIHAFVWLIGPPEYTTNELAVLLQKYTQESGATYLLYSGAETLPPIADLLDPFSYSYKLSYTTQLNESGGYPFKVNVRRDSLNLESNEQTLNLTVSPPNPIFLSPPVEIARSWSETKKRSDSVLTPASVEFSIIIEFPDGHERSLVSSQLLVDDKLADENTAAPFDSFSLDLTGYSISADHTLKVVVEDSLGLKGETIEIPVSIQIQERQQNWIDSILSRINLVNGIIGGIILLMALIGMIALVRFGKQNRRKKIRTGSQDPLTQPVDISGEYSLSPSKLEKPVEWPVIHGIGLAPARLISKPSPGSGTENFKEIPLSGEETTIGSDYRKADLVITHSSVSPSHARIFKDAKGDFHLSDAGSSAGTWLNYAPVSSHGARLEHGDLVQFGRVSYVFELHGAAPKRIQVLPYREE